MANREMVKEIVFSIEQPNGQTKLVKPGEKVTSELHSMTFVSDEVDEKLLEQVVRSGDWQDTAEMVLIDHDMRSNPHCRWKHHLEHGDW